MSKITFISSRLSVWSEPALIKVFVYKITVNKLLYGPEISFFIVYFFVYQTVNRGDHRSVPCPTMKMETFGKMQTAHI